MGNALEKVSAASEKRTQYLVIIISTVLGVSLLLVFGLFMVITHKKHQREKHLVQLRQNLTTERLREQVDQAQEVAMERAVRWQRSHPPAYQQPGARQQLPLDLEMANVFQNPDYGRNAIASTITPMNGPGIGYPPPYRPYSATPSHNSPHGYY